MGDIGRGRGVGEGVSSRPRAAPPKVGRRGESMDGLRGVGDGLIGVMGRCEAEDDDNPRGAEIWRVRDDGDRGRMGLGLVPRGVMGEGEGGGLFK